MIFNNDFMMILTDILLLKVQTMYQQNKKTKIMNW